jgi:preprotein translocase subunit SecE
MGKQRSAGMTSFWEELIHVGVYKRNQGRVTRQVTLATMAIIVLLGTLSLYNLLEITWSESTCYAVAATVLLGGMWLSYRMVNYPRFADFLIAVEAEMNKVSWPSKNELIRSSLVVLFVILALTTVLFFFDIFWQMAFAKIGIISK